MNKLNHSNWAELYRAALLESDISKLPRLVEDAMGAIHARLHELQTCELDPALRIALEDALQNLKVLQREYS